MTPVVNLAYYRKQDWKQFLKMIDDRESVEDTWKEWHEEYLRTKMVLKSQGFIVRAVVVDLDELKSYCAVRGMKNDAQARSQFVSEKRDKGRTV